MEEDEWQGQMSLRANIRLGAPKIKGGDLDRITKGLRDVKKKDAEEDPLKKYTATAETFSEPHPNDDIPF